MSMTMTLLNSNAPSGTLTFNSFGDLIAGKSTNAFSIGVTAPDVNCPWDLYIEPNVSLTQSVAYSTQGTALPLTAVQISAFNYCYTPNQQYPLGAGIRPAPAISGNLVAALGGAFAASAHYIVGTAATDGRMGDNAAGGCGLLTYINDAGTPTANPSTNTFRIDLNIVPGVTTSIQPGLYILSMNIDLAQDGGPVLETLTYSLEIDIQPIMSLSISGNSPVAFEFAQLSDYTAGVTKYGATTLKVQSSVNWDLIAIGTSTSNESSLGTTPFWDAETAYGTVIASTKIPLDILELFQTPGNPATGRSGVGYDYSPAFTTPPSGNNNIVVAYGHYPLTGVGVYAGLGSIAGSGPGAKCIAGRWTSLAGPFGTPGNAVAPGSYQVNNGTWSNSNYNYSISYRLYPGLPVLFSHTKLLPQGAMVGPSGTTTFAQPGAYTMEVRYILSEDQ